jgi:hypothetical protein
MRPIQEQLQRRLDGEETLSKAQKEESPSLPEDPKKRTEEHGLADDPLAEWVLSEEEQRYQDRKVPKRAIRSISKVEVEEEVRTVDHWNEYLYNLKYERYEEEVSLEVIEENDERAPSFSGEGVENAAEVPEVPSPEKREGKERVKRSKNRIITANQRLQEAEEEPDVEPLVGGLFQVRDLAILFGDTNVGKTLAGYTIAEELSKGKEKVLGLESNGGCKRVLYYDDELHDPNFKQRYQGHRFSDELLISKEPPTDGNGNIDTAGFRDNIEDERPDILIIDNITSLAAGSSTETEVALHIMSSLKGLKEEFGISILVIAHTPKRDPKRPIDTNALGGSKHLADFADTISGIGGSVQDRDLRYLKHLKSRTMQIPQEVYLQRVVESDTFLGLSYEGIGQEYEHLKKPKEKGKKKEQEEAERLREEGYSYQQISEKLEVPRSTIGNWLKDS